MAIKRKPNIVFVLTDDQGYGDLGCTGNPKIHTANIDGFHKDSIRMTNYHVGPTCAPTRAGLLTGHYANSTGVWHTIGGRSLLRKDEWTIASALKENGYKTGIFGKWHLGDEYPYRPSDRGFDKSVIHGGGGISQTPDYWGNDYFDDTYLCNGEYKPYKGYCTDVFFREAMDFIDKNKDRPFFCYIATNAPHAPYNVDKKYYEMYKDLMPEDRARFYGMITNIDENFGMLREYLKKNGLEDNTILVFMTDNGTSGGATLDSEGFLKDGYNAGLRGKKGSEYDGGHRVPFFIRWPDGNIQGGKDIDDITCNVDVMPTLLDLCDINTDKNFHGQSITPLFYDNTKTLNRTMVTDSQRLTNPVKWRKSAVMTNRWRLINGKELYDMNVDKKQQNDVSDEYSDVVSGLRCEYEKWWKLVSKQFNREIPISLGEKPNVLTGHDWRNQDCNCPWNQGFVRQGLNANGYWEIYVEKSGDYIFELRRWPKETNRPIQSGINGDDIKWKKDCVPKEYRWYYTGGKALNLTSATVYIQNKTYKKKIGKEDERVFFDIYLNKGNTHLKTRFENNEGFSIGAYYVYVKRK